MGVREAAPPRDEGVEARAPRSGEHVEVIGRSPLRALATGGRWRLLGCRVRSIGAPPLTGVPDGLLMGPGAVQLDKRQFIAALVYR